MTLKSVFKRTSLLLLALAVLSAFAVPAAPAFADNQYNIPEDVIYVSDLPDISHELIDTPGITDGINQGLVGDDPKMIVNGVEYKKGFCTHPISASEPSVITVNIGQYSDSYPLFHVLVGKDYTTEAGGPGHPFKFEILADGDPVYQSDALELGQTAEVFVDVEGVGELTILCSAAGPFAWLTTDFVDACLCKRDAMPDPPPSAPPTDAPATDAPAPTGEPAATGDPVPTERPSKVFISDLSGITHELIDSAGITDGINKALVNGTRITLNGKEYDKGFCTHPVSADTPSEIKVNVGDYSSEYPVLHLIAGKDDSTAGGGEGHPIMYEVLADGQSIYLSEQMEYGSEEEIYLNVAGAQEISLICYTAGPFAWLTTDFADAYLCALEIQEVRLAAAPVKTFYLTGEPLSVNGGELEIVYSNGYTLRLDVTENMVSGFDSSKTGTQVLTVTYGGAALTYEVNVDPAPVTKVPEATPSGSTQSTSGNTGSEKSSTKGSLSGGALAAIIACAAAAVIAAAVAAAIIAKKRKKDNAK